MNPTPFDAPTKCEALNEVINELEASEAPFYRGIEKLKAHRRVHLAERHQIKLALNLPDMSYEPNLAEAVTAQLELLRAELDELQMQLRLSRELEEQEELRANVATEALAEASAARDALQQQADALRKALEKVHPILAQRDNSYFFDMLKEWEEDWLTPALCYKISP